MPEPERSERPEPPRTGLDGLQMVFLIAMCIGGFLFLLKPAANSAQLIFRLSVVGVGAVGLLVVNIIKLNRPR
jgi:hypothetical protein